MGELKGVALSGSKGVSGCGMMLFLFEVLRGWVGVEKVGVVKLTRLHGWQCFGAFLAKDEPRKLSNCLRIRFSRF
jgi:hypothetical protein